MAAMVEDEEGHGSDRWRHEDRKEKAPLIKLRERLGVEDLLNLDVWRASMSELLGTAALVFLIDTIVICTIKMETKTPNLIIAILIALSITILLLAVAPISGGHINPIVSFSAALVGVISISRAVIYILAQCIGGVIGALALRAVVNNTIEQNFSLGGCTLRVVTPGPNGPVTTGIETAQALWIEIICTFVFLFTSIWMAFDGRQAKKLGPVSVCSIIGLVLGLLVFISTSITGTKEYAGAGLNPARCLGPALVRQGNLWNGHWVFWVGPAIGGLAFYLYTKIIPRQLYLAKGYKHDFFNHVNTMVRRG